MKKFLLLLHDDMNMIGNLSPKEMEELVNAHMAWANQLSERGNLIEGEGLEEKCVLISGKDSVVKDGPFLEAKEMIGGFYLLQGDDLESIVQIAKSCPCHLWGGITEVRPIMQYDE